MMDKVLTISVAAYNVEKYIGTLIESVIGSQAAGKIEIIVVDDGSKDKTSDIVKTYCNKCDSVRLVTKENGGYGSTINRALEIAEGKYFRLLDGDDVVQTENIDEYIQYLEDCDSDIVLTPYVRFSENGSQERILNRHSISEKTSFIEECNGKEIEDIHMAELTVKTRILTERAISITENCFYTDNEIVFFAMLYAKTISKFHRPIYRYRIGVEGQSVSAEGKIKHYEDGLIVEEKMLKIFQNERDNLGSNASKSIEVMMINLALFNYGNLILLPDTKKRFRESKEFDALIKRYNDDIYRQTSDSKTIRFLRKTKFYGLKIANLRAKIHLKMKKKIKV